MPFTTPIELSVPPYDTNGLIVAQPINFRSHKRNKNYVIPQGFKTDLVSFSLLRGKIANGPAVLHDWLYEFGKKFKQIKNRSEADSIFYEAMVDSGIPRWKAWVMWSQVRIWGWQFFESINVKNHRLHDEAETFFRN